MSADPTEAEIKAASGYLSAELGPDARWFALTVARYAARTAAEARAEALGPVTADEVDAAAEAYDRAFAVETDGECRRLPDERRRHGFVAALDAVLAGRLHEQNVSPETMAALDEGIASVKAKGTFPIDQRHLADETCPTCGLDPDDNACPDPCHRAPSGALADEAADVERVARALTRHQLVTFAASGDVPLKDASPDALGGAQPSPSGRTAAVTSRGRNR